LKDLSKTNEEDEGFIQVSFQKRKIVALISPVPKRAKKVPPASKPREFVIPSMIRRHIKKRATKANPKIGEKE